MVEPRATLWNSLAQTGIKLCLMHARNLFNPFVRSPRSSLVVVVVVVVVVVLIWGTNWQCWESTPVFTLLLLPVVLGGSGGNTDQTQVCSACKACALALWDILCAIQFGLLKQNNIFNSVEAHMFSFYIPQPSLSDSHRSSESSGGKHALINIYRLLIIFLGYWGVCHW